MQAGWRDIFQGNCIVRIIGNNGIGSVRRQRRAAQDVRNVGKQRLVDINYVLSGAEIRNRVPTKVWHENKGVGAPRPGKRFVRRAADENIIPSRADDLSPPHYCQIHMSG